MRRRLRGSSSWIVDSVLVSVVAAVLIWPLFHLNYSDKWASIESTFIADARFLKDHWPHPLWQPLWYTGTRFDYVYPPALRYGTAVLMKLRPLVSPARAYHFYVAVLYCLGISGVYLLARIGGRSRKFAIVAALAVATVSPSFLFIDEIYKDARASWSEPQRLGVLVRYGEGPHISAVAVLGFALAFSIQALRTGGAGWIASAAISCALVVAHNFYGATSLAMTFPIVLWSWWVTHQDHRIFWRAAAVMGLSYGLCAFWLAPSYIAVTLDNLRFVSERGNRWSLWVTAGLAILYMKLTERWTKGRQHLAYRVFLIGAIIFLSLNVIGNYYLQFRVIGEPARMVPELDLVLLIAGAELLRLAWSANWRFSLPRRAVVAVMVFLLFYSVRKYIMGAWHIYVPGEPLEARLEYQISEWLNKNMPEARAYTTGTVRFWFNTWHDLAQLGGGSEQGLLNPVVQPATWHLGLSEDGEHALYWMRCTGVDVAVVHLKNSKEHYHDVVHPEKFAATMKAVYDDGQGNLIYHAGRRYPGVARVVNASSLDSLQPMEEDPSKEKLKALAELLEKGPEAAVETHWEGTDRLHIRTTVAEGQVVFVQVPFDRAWRAYSGGQALSIRKTQMNFMRVSAPAGDRPIDLMFELPLENVIGRMVTLGSLAVVVLLFRRAWRAP
ncbi:MAG TPA: hypothetical protein VM120_27800 [Bryobacteraceae bacterium]|nr:hypothetical protein [Bryobacteraceae bacterium]